MGVYGPAIAGVNLIILISSTVLIYFGNILINFYLIDTLEFVHANFSTMPNLMLAVGVLGLLGGILGVIVGATSQRCGLIIHAVFGSLIFILQLASIFVTAEVRADLEHDVLERMTYDLPNVTTQYWTQPDFKERWDEVQRSYACCGFNGFNTGYQETKDCGEGQLISQKAHLEVYTHGCLTVLQQRMSRDIKPVLDAYLGCGVALALLQIMTIVLSAAYSAALNRRKRREEERYSSARGEEKRSLYHFTDNKDATMTLPPIMRDSGLPSSAAGSMLPSLEGSCSRRGSRYASQANSQVGSRHASQVPSLAGSRRNMNDDDERISRGSFHVEPTDESGTAI